MSAVLDEYWILLRFAEERIIVRLQDFESMEHFKKELVDYLTLQQPPK